MPEDPGSTVRKYEFKHKCMTANSKETLHIYIQLFTMHCIFYMKALY